jgi:hypothetical protein
LQSISKEKLDDLYDKHLFSSHKFTIASEREMAISRTNKVEVKLGTRIPWYECSVHVCLVCDKNVNLGSLKLHLSETHKLGIDEYEIIFGLKENTLSPTNFECMVCASLVTHTLTPIKTHLWVNHNLSMADYYFKYVKILMVEDNNNQVRTQDALLLEPSLTVVEVVENDAEKEPREENNIEKVLENSLQAILKRFSNAEARHETENGVDEHSGGPSETFVAEVESVVTANVREKENGILVNSDVDEINSQKPKLEVYKIGERFIVERTDIYPNNDNFVWNLVGKHKKKICFQKFACAEENCEGLKQIRMFGAKRTKSKPQNKMEVVYLRKHTCFNNGDDE